MRQYLQIMVEKLQLKQKQCLHLQILKQVMLECIHIQKEQVKPIITEEQ